MSSKNAYDISSEIDPVDKMDEIQARLEQRRREKANSHLSTAGEAAAKSEAHAADESRPEDRGQPGGRKRAADTARKKRDEETQRREARERELRESRWITAGHKVREKRVEHLERVYYRLKAEGEFVGTKQEFYDEGFALLEQKYRQEPTS
ncbi:MAG: hypothetical protein KDA37_10020 [Planctomycetales bacterium]|nr:hypothetical protein [Planctomycetales bacterium]